MDFAPYAENFYVFKFSWRATAAAFCISASSATDPASYVYTKIELHVCIWAQERSQGGHAPPNSTNFFYIIYIYFNSLSLY